MLVGKLPLQKLDELCQLMTTAETSVGDRMETEVIHTPFYHSLPYHLPCNNHADTTTPSLYPTLHNPNTQTFI